MSAVRRISTRLAIDGEAQYKQAITSINSELTKLKSSLALVSSEYRNNANTTEALNAKQKALQELYASQQKKVTELRSALENAQRAQKQHSDSVEEYKRKISAAEAELKKLKNSTGDTTKEQEKLTAEIKDLENGLSEATAKQEAATRGVNDWQKKLNSATVELNKLDDEVAENNKHLDEAKASTEGVATSIDQYGKTVKTATDDSKKFGETSKQAVDTMAQALAAAGVVASLKQIADAIYDCINASMEFESAITGVYKTVEGTPEQLQAISDGIKELSLRIPATTTEIAAVGEAAGQLGIATDDVLDFTEVMINLGVATNMTADESASMLAKFANITGLNPSDYGRLGSVITALGNNFATTEQDITTMSTRLASAGTIAGLSETEIMALAAAMSSVGIGAEAGGTAISQTMSAIEKAVQGVDETLEDFARVSGMSAAEFAKTWEDRPIEAIQAFVSGLGGLEEQGESATVILDEMGLSGIRQSNMLKALSLSSENLGNAVSLSNKAWDENNALTEEAEKRYQTAESKQILLKNSVNLLQVAIGDALLPAFNNLNEGLTDVLQWITTIVEENPWLVKIITALAIGIGGITIAIAGYTAATKLAAAAQGLLNAAMLTNPATLIAIAIATLTTGIILFTSSMQDASSEYKNLNDDSAKLGKTIEEANKTYEESSKAIDSTAFMTERYVNRLKELESQTRLTTAEKKEYEIIVGELNELMPELNAQLDEETGLLIGGVAAIEAKTRALVEQQRQQILQERYGEIIRANAEAEAELAENTYKLNKANAEHNTIAAAMRKKQEEIAEALGVTTSELDELDWTTWAYHATAETAGETTDALLREYEALTGELALAEMEQRIFDEAVQTSTDNINSNADALEEATEVYAMASEGIGETNAAFQVQSDTIAGIQNEIDNLNLKYEEAYIAAYESISEQVNGFEELGVVSGTSIDTLIGNLQSQVDYMDQYAENIKRAMALGIDEGLIQKLSDGSVESAEILQGIVDDGGQNIDELNEALKNVEEGKENFADSIAKMETDFDESMSEIEKRALEMAKDLDKSITTYKSGEDTVQAYIDGIESQYGNLEQTFKTLAQKGSNAYNSNLSFNGANIKWNGSHADGLDYVPFDGYIAQLHKGEMVLTASEAAAYAMASIPSRIDFPQSHDYSQALRDILTALYSQKGVNQTFNVSSSNSQTPAQRDAAIYDLIRRALYDRR